MSGHRAWPSAPSPDRIPPKLEAVAETKLLMEGLAHPNFAALAKGLNLKPADDESWMITRGQSLLIAETGNLLMLRPPKGRPAQGEWMQHATDLRVAAAKLANATGDRDFGGSRTAFAGLANVCNRCHEKFEVKTRVSPLAD